MIIRKFYVTLFVINCDMLCSSFFVEENENNALTNALKVQTMNVHVILREESICAV